jgi:hypothetical protein
MSTTPICPCDSAAPPAITNLPNLSQVSFRAGDFNSFRSALLTPLLNPPGQPPLEQSLGAWQSGVDTNPSVVDLAVMMVEWWAYLADILTFYNERIANEDYLQTAILPETPANLIAILGYRPRPTIGAVGTLAALVTPSVLPGQTVTLPARLQFQSKPGPGGAPQTFELSAATTIGPPGLVPTIPPPNLIANLGRYLWLNDESIIESGALSGLLKYVYESHVLTSSAIAAEHIDHDMALTSTLYGILVQGSVTSVSNGTMLLLGTRDDTVAATLITLQGPPVVQPAPGGGKQTVLTFTAATTPDMTMTASNARLRTAGQTAALWTANSGAFDNSGSQTVVHMASVVRQIRPNDWVVFSAPSLGFSQLIQVSQTADVFGDATSAGAPGSIPSTDKTPIPLLHTMLTLDGTLSSLGSNSASYVSVLFGWVEVGTLVDQPPALWDGTAPTLQAVQPATFPMQSSTPILLLDSNGNGQAATGNADATNLLSVLWPTGTTPPLSPVLQPPINVYYNLLPVTCGKTVANEVLGSGDATAAGQTFKLSKSPVTYLTVGVTYASTIVLTVNGQPWSEVLNFYNQPANAQVFVTREDSNQNTWVSFGDGVNGARLTTGTNNVVATYRIGGGASSPPANNLTVIAQSYPGLQSIVNPVAVTGGSDPDPAGLLKEYAPRSVLAFGRAVSVFDYQALAAQAPRVTMAAATWSWDENNARGSVTVYVAGELNVATSVQTSLSAAGDPNRPVTVLTATEVVVTLTFTIVYTAGMDSGAIATAVQTALCDPTLGLFSPPQIAIGQGLFDSQIEAACLAVSGVVAITGSQFTINGTLDTEPLHSPGEGAYFSLVPANFFPSTQVAAND